MARKDPYLKSLAAGKKRRALFNQPITKGGKTTGLRVLPGETLYQAATRLKIDPRQIANASSFSGGSAGRGQSLADLLASNKPLEYGALIEGLGTSTKSDIFGFTDGKLQSLKYGKTSGYTGRNFEAAFAGGKFDDIQDIELGQYIEPDDLMEKLNQPVFGGSGRPAYSSVQKSLSGSRSPLSTPKLSTKQGTPAQEFTKTPDINDNWWDKAKWGTAGQGKPSGYVVDRGDARYQEYIDKGFTEDPNYKHGSVARLLPPGDTPQAPQAPRVMESSTGARGAENELAIQLDPETEAQTQADVKLAGEIKDAEIEDLQKRFDDALKDATNISDLSNQSRLDRQEGENVQARGIASGGGLGAAVSQTGVMLKVAKSHRTESALFEAQRSSAIKAAQQALKDGQAQLARDKFNEARSIQQDAWDREDAYIAKQLANEKALDEDDKRAQDFMITTATSIAPAIVASWGNNPVANQELIDSKAEEYGIDPMILRGAVEDYRYGLKGGTGATGADGVGGLTEADKVKTANSKALSDGISYEEAYRQLYGQSGTETGSYGAIIGDPDGQIMGLPAYNTEESNPGATRSNRNNNPGNIKVSDYTKDFDGAIGVEIKNAQDGGNFLVFDSPESGFAAMGRLLTEGKSYQGVDAETAMRRWSGGVNQDGTLNGRGYGAAATGLNPDTDFQSQIQDTTELNRLVQNMAKVEGYDPTQTSGVARDQIADADSRFLTDKTEQQKQIYLGLNAQDKANVRQIISGDALLSDLGSGMKGAVYRQRISAIAVQLDPEYSETTNKIRFNTQKRWDDPNAKPFNSRGSINTSMGHLAQLKKDADELQRVRKSGLGVVLPSNLTDINALSNWYQKHTGHPEITNFMYTLTIVASEIASAYKGATATDQETEKVYQTLRANYASRQITGVINQASKLLSSKITAMAQEYENVMGRYPENPIVQDYIMEDLRSAGVDVAEIERSLRFQGYDIQGTSGTDVQPSSPQADSWISGDYWTNQGIN